MPEIKKVREVITSAARKLVGAPEPKTKAPRKPKTPKPVEFVATHASDATKTCPDCQALVKGGVSVTEYYHEEVHVRKGSPIKDHASTWHPDPKERMSLADKIAFEKDAQSRLGREVEVTPETVEELRKSREVQEVKEKRSTSSGKAPPPPPTKVENDSQVEVGKTASGRYLIWGFPVTAIFRFMGSAGWDKSQAMLALTALGIPDGEVSPATAGIQMLAGKKGGDCGGRGPIPALTPEQVKGLDTAAGRIKVEEPKPSTPAKKGAKSK